MCTSQLESVRGWKYECISKADVLSSFVIVDGASVFVEYSVTTFVENSVTREDFVSASKT